MSAQVLVFKNSKVYWGAHDLSGQMNDASIDYSVEELTKHVSGDGTKIVHPGLMAVSSKLGVFWHAQAAPAGIEKTLFQAIGDEADAPFTLAPIAGADGEAALTFRAGLSSEPISGPHGQLARIDASFASRASRLVDGTILMPGTSRGATGNGVARQLGAIAANQRLYVAMHVLAFVGTTLTLEVQSDDNSGMTTPIDRVTSAPFTAVGSAWSELDGAITDDWWRATWTFTGTSFTALLVAGILNK